MNQLHRLPININDDILNINLIQLIPMSVMSSQKTAI